MLLFDWIVNMLVKFDKFLIQTSQFSHYRMLQ